IAAEQNAISGRIYREFAMSLCPPFLLASVLDELQVAGISVVQRDDGWFAERKPVRRGPFVEPHAAREEGMRWLALVDVRQDDENSACAAPPA
ncbi:MAG TPA: hypothetical protein VFT99_18370, partial [Roseiflexaceae bacterium]|nr:hypothetical protein [Roseiflexaceae bacterium]